MAILTVCYVLCIENIWTVSMHSSKLLAYTALTNIDFIMYVSLLFYILIPL